MKSKCTDVHWVGRANCSKCDVRNIVLFSVFNDAELDRMLLPVDNLRADPGAVLYHQGARGGSVFTVRHGMVKLSLDLPEGGFRIVRILRPGDIAGLEILLGEPYRHQATAIGEVDLCRIPREVLKKLDQSYPGVHQQLLLRWQSAIDQAEQMIACLTSGSAEERMARLLLNMGCSDARDAIPILSREDMGALLGVSTETASRIMADFKRRGLVQESRGYCVLCDLQGLQQVANTCSLD